MRDSIVIVEDSFSGKDTLIADKSVEPNTTYTYSVQYSKETSDPITITTMDLSSSTFQWEVLYFGERNNIFNSVSIVDENDIWVVGKFEVWGWDSVDSEYDWLRYNALHWNGIKWDTLKIKPPPWTYSGQFDVVHAINDSIAWIGIDAPALYLNDQWQGMTTAPHLGWMLDIWGNSLSNTFFTYYNGGIAHYNGNTFQVMNSGTDTNIPDIDGNDERVFAVAYELTAGMDKLVLEYDYHSWRKILVSNTVNGDLEHGDFGRLISIKVLDGLVVITSAAASMIKYYYREGIMDFSPKSATPLKDCWAVDRIDGNAINDLAFFTVGGEIVHFNGSNYIKCFDYEDSCSSGAYVYCGDFKGNVICAVGLAQGQGVVIIGRR